MTSQPPPPSLGVTHQRPRPSAAWWVAGGLLVAGGVLVGIGLVVNVFVTMFQTEATVPASGEIETLSLDEDRDYLLWAKESDVGWNCQVVDTATGIPIQIRTMGSTSFSRNDEMAVGWFSSESGDLSMACQGPSAIEVGPRPGAPDWIGGMVGAIVLPILLVLAGIALLVVTGIRFAAARRP